MLMLAASLVRWNVRPSFAGPLSMSVVALIVACGTVTAQAMHELDEPRIANEAHGLSSIAPADLETAWFRLAAVASCLALVWAFYQFHRLRIAHDVSVRQNERVYERERIARELHDTMLQSFQGSVLRIQNARDLLPANPEKAVEALDVALNHADHAIVEGRQAIHQLRSSRLVSDDLAESIIMLAEELTTGSDTAQGATAFRLSIEGAPRKLDSIARDDVCRISHEALRNAFRHAQAKHIEAELTYGARELRVRIRDDGRGIDVEQLQAGSAHHWGLTSMRERAAQIAATLTLWSEIGAGTEVELRIPGSVAYRPHGRSGALLRWGRSQETVDEH